MLSKPVNLSFKYIGAICAGLLLLLIILLPHNTIWDEDWYMYCVGYLKYYGFTRNFVHTDPAAPMHAIIYYLLGPITHDKPVAIRLVNYVMCLSTCFFVYKTILLIKPEMKINFTYTLTLFAVPCFFVIGFFAISEAPCLLLYSISVYLFLKSVSAKKNIMLVLLAGIFLGLAIMTRQLFLLCIMPPVLLLFFGLNKQHIIMVALYIIASLLICAPIFYIWKGLTPPGSVFHHSLLSLLAPKNLFLSFGYAFLYFMCLIPKYLYGFLTGRKIQIMVLTLLGIATSFIIKDASFLPMSGLLPRIFPEQAIVVIAKVYFVIVCILSFYLFYFFIYEFFTNLKNFTQVFLLASIALILFSAIAVHDQFSSRYPLQSAPLMLIFCYNRMRPVGLKVQVLICAVVIITNLISVVTFFN